MYVSVRTHLLLIAVTLALVCVASGQSEEDLPIRRRVDTVNYVLGTQTFVSNTNSLRILG